MDSNRIWGCGIMVKLYAQLDSENICTCIGTPKTDIEVSDYTNLGNKHVDGVWEEVPDEPIPAQPTNAELAQLVSDLQADLLIAGEI